MRMYTSTIHNRDHKAPPSPPLALSAPDINTLLLLLDGDVVPRSTLVVLLGNLLNDRCEVSLVLPLSINDLSD